MEPDLPQSASPEPSEVIEPPYGAVEYWSGWNYPADFTWNPPPPDYTGYYILIAILIFSFLGAVFVWYTTYIRKP